MTHFRRWRYFVPVARGFIPRAAHATDQIRAGHKAPRYKGPGKGDGSILPERPFGCFAQNTPVPFSSRAKSASLTGGRGVLEWGRKRMKNNEPVFVPVCRDYAGLAQGTAEG